MAEKCRIHIGDSSEAFSGSVERIRSLSQDVGSTATHRGQLGELGMPDGTKVPGEWVPHSATHTEPSPFGKTAQPTVAQEVLGAE
jgi:hypothetical protein